MKKSHVLLRLAMFSVFLAACVLSNSPESVGQEALAAWYRGDVDKLISLSAPDARRTALAESFYPCSYVGLGCSVFGTRQRVNIKEVVVRPITRSFGSHALVTIVFVADGQKRKHVSPWKK